MNSLKRKQTKALKKAKEKIKNQSARATVEMLFKQWKEIGELIAETGSTIGHGIKQKMKDFNKELRLLSKDETIIYLNKIANDPDIIRQTATYRKAIINEILLELEGKPKTKGTKRQFSRKQDMMDESQQEAANAQFGIHAPYWPSLRYAPDRLNARLRKQALKAQGIK